MSIKLETQESPTPAIPVWERKVYPDPVKPGMFVVRAGWFVPISPQARRCVRVLHRDGFTTEAAAEALDCESAWSAIPTVVR